MSEVSPSSQHTAGRVTSPLQHAPLILPLLHLRLELKFFNGFPIKSSSQTLAWHLRPIILTQCVLLGLSPLPLSEIPLFSQIVKLLIPKEIFTSDSYSQLALYVLFHCCLKVLLIAYVII